eukprot:5160696-Amphidinium_carterae.1
MLKAAHGLTDATFLCQRLWAVVVWACAPKTQDVEAFTTEYSYKTPRALWSGTPALARGDSSTHTHTSVSTSSRKWGDKTQQAATFSSFQFSH